MNIMKIIVFIHALKILLRNTLIQAYGDGHPINVTADQ